MSNQTLLPELIENLNQLLSRAHDAEQGYLLAAETTHNQALRDFFDENSRQRYHFREELRSHLLDLEADPSDSPSLAGMVHQPFMKIKSVLSNHNDIALIEECRRGERTCILDYKAALELPDLPEAVARTIRRHGKYLLEQLEALRSIESALKTGV